MTLKDLQSKEIENATTVKLEGDELQEYLDLFDMWGIDDVGRFVSNFEFNDFRETVDFLNGVADFAEEVNHHPDLMIYNYKNLLIMLYTHNVDGLTEKDFIFASKIEKILEDAKLVK